MHAATEAIGMMASLTSFLLWLPQGARVWKYRHDPSQLAGIALSTQVIALAGNLLWGVYALLIGSFWLGAPAVVNGPIAIGTILVLRRGAAVARAVAARQDAVALPVPSASLGLPDALDTMEALEVLDALEALEPAGAHEGRELVAV
jgi:uncharacterized protein with PQ loop repeat